MKNLALLLALLISTIAINVDAQESHVQLDYWKGIDRTVVHSDLLYVINTPSQFMQIQLVGRYAGKGKPAQAPDRIYMEFYSFAPDAVYQLDAKHRLQVKVDDRVLDFGLLSYSKVDGQAKDEKDKTNPKRLSSNLEVEVSLPPTAVITKTRTKPSLTKEFMSIKDLSLSDLGMLASATDLVMKIGDTVFRLTPIQIAIIREFTSTITPAKFESAAATTTTEKSPPGVPSDENKAPLADTLKWLKNEMEHESATKDVVIPRKFEPIDFKTCRISYRIMPLVQHSPVSNNLVYAIMEYQLNLADLNPEAVAVSDLADYASVFLVTRDYRPTIKLIKHANENGITGRTLEDGLTESALINLRSKSAAAQFKTAMVHAINLCRNQP